MGHLPCAHRDRNRGAGVDRQGGRSRGRGADHDGSRSGGGRAGGAWLQLAGPPQPSGDGAHPALRRRRPHVADRPRRPHARGFRIMSMNVANPDAEDDLVADINTTPLVDVMLVLLIIFLITIPVVIQSVPVELPKERNQPTQTKPENIVIAVNKDGDVFWNNQLIVEEKMLLDRLREVAVRQPQPEIHIRVDKEARYESIGRVVFACQRIGILKLGFITEPPARTGSQG